MACPPPPRLVTAVGCQVYVWNCRNGEQQAECSSHTYNVTCVAISPDDRVVVSGSQDRRWVQGPGFRVVVSGSQDRRWVQDPGFRVQGSGVQGPGSRVQGFACDL